MMHNKENTLKNRESIKNKTLNCLKITFFNIIYSKFKYYIKRKSYKINIEIIYKDG